MERSVEVLAIILLGVLGLSHLLHPRPGRSSSSSDLFGRIVGVMFMG
jgi:hypothetical protein